MKKQSRPMGNAIIFIAGEFFNKGISFLVLPILTAHLTPSDYGIASSYQSALLGLMVLIGLSSHGCITVFYYKLPIELFKKLVSAIAAMCMFTFVLLLTVFWFAQGYVIDYFQISVGWALCFPVIAFSQVLSLMLSCYFQIVQKTGLYVTFQVLQTIVNLLITLYLVVAEGWGWDGRLSGVLFSALIGAIVAIGLFFKYELLTINFGRDDFQRLWRFSAPLVPHGLSSWFKTSIDKVILMGVVSTAYLGEYAVLYTLCSMLSVLYMAANKGISPFVFQILAKNEPDAKVKLRKLNYMLVLLTVASALFYWIVLPFVYDIMIDKQYRLSHTQSLCFMLGFMFQGLYLIISNYLFYHEKTKVISKIGIFNAVAHILLLYILINVWGVLGVAITNMISWLILLVCAGSAAYKHKVLP